MTRQPWGSPSKQLLENSLLAHLFTIHHYCTFLHCFYPDPAGVYQQLRNYSVKYHCVCSASAHLLLNGMAKEHSNLSDETVKLVNALA